jgi:hypothetical protein
MKSIGIYGDSYCSVMNPELNPEAKLDFWSNNLKKFYSVIN